MYTSVKKMGQKAFTLVELIIVIVIVGILAAISIVGYQSVVDRAEEQAVKASLESVDREYRALDAFTIADGGHVLKSEMTVFSELTFTNSSGGSLSTVDHDNDAGTPAVEVLVPGDKAVWTQDGKIGTLTFQSSTTPGGIVVVDAP